MIYMVNYRAKISENINYRPQKITFPARQGQYCKQTLNS
jgi:hypothetical protein